MLRAVIYFFKRLVHTNLPLYQLVYSLLTLNVNYLKQRLAAPAPLTFGGMWTDRKDYPRQLAARQRVDKINPDTLTQLEQWREQGFIILKGAVDEALINQYLEELAALKQEQPMRLRVTAATLPEPALYSPGLLESESSVRTVDDYFFSPASREILMNPAIMNFVEKVFDARHC